MASPTIFLVLSDEHTTHCMTEELLDTWWSSLEPELKAEILEAAMDGSDSTPNRSAAATQNA